MLLVGLDCSLVCAANCLFAISLVLLILSPYIIMTPFCPQLSLRFSPLLHHCLAIDQRIIQFFSRRLLSNTLYIVMYKTRLGIRGACLQRRQVLTFFNQNCCARILYIICASCKAFKHMRVLDFSLSYACYQAAKKKALHMRDPIDFVYFHNLGCGPLSFYCHSIFTGVKEP